jgi:hypothetical protein
VAERIGTIILSALVAHTGWHWLTERMDRVAQFRFEWPTITAAQLASALGWLTVMVFLAGLAWLFSLVFQRRRERRAAETLPIDRSIHRGLIDSHGNSESRETAG